MKFPESRKIEKFGYLWGLGGAAILGILDLVTNKVPLNAIILCLVVAIFFKPTI